MAGGGRIELPIQPVLETSELTQSAPYKNLADGEGIEPPEAVTPLRFSRPAPSTARPTIHLIWRKEGESNPQGFYTRPLSRRLPSPIGLSFRENWTGNGILTHVGCVYRVLM